MTVTRPIRFDWQYPDTCTEVYFCRGQSDFSEIISGQLNDIAPFVVIDSNVDKYWDKHISSVLKSVSFTKHILSATEEQKRLSTLEEIWKSMADAGVRRDTPVVVIGGGLTCDLGAFAASTYLRGLPLILIPTSLLCMVDACLGGKTAVNFRKAKNRIGTFYTASSIIVMAEFLTTLPEQEFASGMGEAIKTALIGNSDIATLIREISGDARQSGSINELVGRCLEVKGKIVSRDLIETGERMILNCGHTIGHALESTTDFSLIHGAAVGLGLLVESRMGAMLGSPAPIEDDIRSLLRASKLPVAIPPEIPDIMEFMQMDKKTQKGGRVWALPFGWEDCRLVKLSPTEETRLLQTALNAILV